MDWDKVWFTLGALAVACGDSIADIVCRNFLGG
jgi:hypothetical protein